MTAAVPLATSGGSPDTLLIVGLIIALGVAAQVLADRFRVPSVLFLILAGIAVGPKGFSIVTTDTFGAELSTVVGVSVAVIVFEGAFNLKIKKLREAPASALRLVTVGAAIAFVGTTVAVYYILGVGWGVSAVTGALLIATGPTVVTPILSVVSVRDPVAAALEIEGIVNDVTAAVAAVVFFSLLSSESVTVSGFVSEFVKRLSLGVFVGLVTAAVLWYLLARVELPRGWSPQNARLVILAGAVLAFSVADTLEPEAGVAAVATAGVVLGNADLPYEERIEEFKGDITILVLSFVFIALAALIEFETLISLGLAGLGVVAVITLVLRPLLVFVSTRGDVFSRNEKLFMSFVGPRGIIPASVATLFALRLTTREPPSNPEAASVLAGTVFLVILVTVVFEGGLARQIAERLQVIPMQILIIGGGRVGRELAGILNDRDENVVVLENDEAVVEELRERGLTVKQGDGTKVGDLLDAGAEDAKIAVAATGDDDTNLLVTQLADIRVGVDRVITRVNEPDNRGAFEELGIEMVAASSSTAHAIDDLIERPAISGWMSELEEDGEVQEIEMSYEEFVGKTVGEIDEVLPRGCVVALVSRGGENKVPELDLEIEHGDNLTILGRTEAVETGMDRLHPHD